jgi:hypothetical protein
VKGSTYPLELKVRTNTQFPEVPTDGKLEPIA